MTVSSGNKALASEYTTLNQGISEWFADNHSSVTFGDSNQTRGWGGLDGPSIITGDDMLVTEMNELIDRCNIGADICSSVVGPLSYISVGNDILATDYNTIETKSGEILTNRNTIDPAEMSTGTVHNIVRSTSWSAVINCQTRWSFGSFANARYFFNSGGAIQVSGSITGYSTGTGYDGAGIDEILTNMGTVTIDMDSTIQSGSGGSITSIGYYDSTIGYLDVIQQSGTGAYSDALLVIYIHRDTTGASFEVKIDIVPGSGRTVDGTTTMNVNYRKLDNQSSGTATLSVSAPSYTLINSF